MKPLTLVLLLALLVPAAVADDQIATDDGVVTVRPVRHGTLVLSWKKTTIYIDPVGGADLFKGIAAPDLVLVTDIHGDHFHAPTLAAVCGEKTKVIAPQAVFDKMPAALQDLTQTLANDKSRKLLGVTIEAIPMYNLTKERLRFHTKGRGNGYVITLGGKRFYVSGDTEDIPEMRNLKEIDVAFVCMNLPYTMDVKQAARAVLIFRPRIVYPYHYRGQGGTKSDLQMFRSLVGDDLPIEVRLRDWYAE
jgi:L-ascorbate metabolism protein UlaG (beta-lactamase superfamily)